MDHTAAKHILNTPETLVTESIQGLCYTNPNLRILEKDKVVYYANVDEMASKQVTLVSGGGSGHEPGYASYVGDGSLAASVCGHVFASPSSSQVLAAIKRVQSPHGSLVIIMNYTGDCLNFGLAVERAKTCGIKVDLIAVGDDISVGKAKGRKVGRRGMAATALAIKIGGALASRGAPLEKVKEIIQNVIDNAATLGVAFDHCHVPGSASFTTLKSNELEIGMGIHNEKGFVNTDMMPANKLVTKMLDMLLDQRDMDRSYLNLDSDKPNSVVMLINNLGGIAQLELNLAVKESVEYLLNHPSKIKLERVLVGPFVTSLNMSGFSITLFIVNDDILDLLDQKVSIPGWPSTPAILFSSNIHGNEPISEGIEHTVDDFMGQVNDPKVLEAAIRGATQAAIDAEPRITDYDTILGDGDCGQTLKTAALAIQDALSTYKLFSAPKTVLAMAETIEHSVGGTSSAIYCIFLNALASGLLKHAKPAVDSSVWVAAARHALATLMTYTKARVGDRTLMDALCAFIDTLNTTGDNLSQAVNAANKGAEGTSELFAVLGRSSYLSNDQVLDAHIPDAGAYGLAQILTGMAQQLLQ